MPECHLLKMLKSVVGSVKSLKAGAVLVLIVVFVSGCAIGIGGEKLGKLVNGNSVELHFFINETGQPLDGLVYLDGTLLGEARDGLVVVNKTDIGPGQLLIQGSDAESGSDFKFKFTLESSDSRFNSIRFEVPVEDYEREIFDASAVGSETVELEIFRLANLERAQRNVKPLRWNDGIAEVARAYSAALPEEGFHHTDTTGRGVKQRLSDAGIIFTVANENLYFSGTLREDTDLATAAVEGWLGSPGHRATLLDRDGLYSDAGVGVHCERRECYAVMNFAAVKQDQKASLKKGWVTFQYLHNPDYDFPFDEVPVRLDLSSSEPVNVYVVPSRNEYEEFIGGGKPGSLEEFEGVVSVSERFLASRGQGLIIESPEGAAEIEFSLDFAG